MKVLNLYACLGGNRLLWEDCEVTSVELDPELARMYQERFPNDTVIVGDAHQYLLDHYKEFDFIWSSPPCPTHSRARFWGSKGGQVAVKYPDLKLYEEIILLENYFNGKWLVENVIPFYTPLIQPTKQLGKHSFWANFLIPEFKTESAHYESQKEIEAFHKIDLSKYKGSQSKKKVARNMVHYETGKHIFDLARGIYKANNSNQTALDL
jgi:DNA (cytosine-5)-methyltransferase 1